MLILSISEKFSASHFLRGYKGQCSRLHGHTWKIVLKIYAPEKQKNGIAIDFKTLKKALRKIIPDHRHLNSVYKFNPTAENLAEYFYFKLRKQYPNIASVQVWESDTAYAEYFTNK